MAAAGPEESESQRRQPIHSIQCIRGVAAILVLLYHSGTVYATQTGALLFGNIFRAGFVGVDVFFVLSGFVIYWLHANDIGKQDKLAGFVKKRFARVFPLYWVVVLAKAVKEWGATSAATLLFAMLLIPYPNPPYINVSWTLTFEMVFYLAFAAMILLPRGLLTLLPIGIIVLLGVAPAPFENPTGVTQNSLNFLFGRHVLEFIFGGIACALAPRLTQDSAKRAIFAGVLVMALFFASASYLAFVPERNVFGPTAYELSEVVSNRVLENKLWLLAIPAAMVLAGAFAWERAGGQADGLARFAWLGDISYSLYLSHAFVVHFALSWTPFRSIATNYPAVMIPTMLGCVFLAGMIHIAVEKPLIRVSRKLLKA